MKMIQKLLKKGAKMEFEFDPDKSASNKVKHGIDFVEGQELWRDPCMYRAPARSDDELRFFVYGMIHVRLYAAIVTDRGDSTRIISIRRARKEEEEEYEKRKHDKRRRTRSHV